MRSNQQCTHNECGGHVILWFLVRLLAQYSHIQHLFNGRVGSSLYHYTANFISKMNPTVVWRSSRFPYNLCANETSVGQYLFLISQKSVQEDSSRDVFSSPTGADFKASVPAL
ncbi:hypothetical protein BsWGS_23143 [Bradybaena similaris]